MKTAAASVMRDSAAEPPILNRIRNTRAFFRKLSLNAEKNWHQNSGAKRRESIRGGGMPLIIAKFRCRRAVAPQKNWAAKRPPKGVATNRSELQTGRCPQMAGGRMQGAAGPVSQETEPIRISFQHHSADPEAKGDGE